MAKFIQKIPSSEAEIICLENFKIIGTKGSTYETTKIPFVDIGTCSIYTIGVRYAKFGMNSTPPHWGFRAACGGAMQEGGFKSMQEAIDAAVKYCKQKEREFNKKFK